MTDILADHFARCPICSAPDDDGNEQICRIARELAKLIAETNRREPRP